ncbi:hypothetical protein BX666DRAFT_1961172 [Dichotomocladium elegans]|nr:hypothetical protein BX666DRAFT_1961172 [Dichotomocladium elegans]
MDNVQGTVAVRSIILVVASVSWAMNELVIHFVVVICLGWRNSVSYSSISWRRSSLVLFDIPPPLVIPQIIPFFTFLSLPSWQRMVHAQ